MKISFDFDGTLQFLTVQDKAKNLIKSGHNVCIVTTRYEDVSKYAFEATHDDLYYVAKTLGITEIHFTDYKWKYKVIDDWDIDFHIDDNYIDEVIPINNNCKCEAILYSAFSNKWFDDLINKITERK